MTPSLHIKTLPRKIVEALLPKSVLLRADAEHYGIVEFMKEASRMVMPSDRVLDVAAGRCPYKKYFEHAKYESCDINPSHGQEHTHPAFVCSMDNVPRQDSSYDAVICTQALHYLRYPQKGIDEIFRVLKPGGKLFLTAAQGWGLTGSPHYFNFTSLGLKAMFEDAGFKIMSIRPRGGVFWYIGNRFRILSQHVWSVQTSLVKIVGLPIYLLAFPILEYALPFLCFYLDRLDRRPNFTLGYACYCVKPESIDVSKK
jgi:Methylase involved in ubiquinone/menaquinone biosynthesis